jgi:hypothetical protein
MLLASDQQVFLEDDQLIRIGLLLRYTAPRWGRPQ